MKKILLSLTCVALLTASCKDILDKSPLTSPTSINYWSTADNLKLYANQFYTGLPRHNDGGRLGIYSLDNNSDNLLPNLQDVRLSGNVLVPSSGGNWNFSRIREANFFLENYHKVPTVGYEEQIRHYAAEVRFFRAYYYYQLLRNFGDVPWINKTLNPDLSELQELTVRAKRNVVADSIIADLDFAIANLMAKERAESLRINREIALLLKSRVCLFEGTWEKHHAGTSFGVEGSDGSNYLRQAADAAWALIDEKKYALSSSYSQLFNQVDQSANPEVLLWKRHNYLLGVHDANLTRSITTGGGSTGMTKSLVESYLCSDGLPISVSPLYKGDKSLNDIKENRDKRLLWTMAFPGYPLQIAPGGADTLTSFTFPPIDQSSQEFRSTSGYQIYKGCDPYTSNQPVNQGEIANVIFRFAEALLNYAEAKAELGTITQVDIDLTINRLRDRAGVAYLQLAGIATDPNWDFPNLSPIVNEIRRERRVEFACEGYRLDDLLRWRAHTIITGSRLKGALYLGSDLEGTYRDASGNNRIIIGTNLFVDEKGYIDPYRNALPSGFGFNPERDYLLPIPTNEITLAGGALKQNPGW